jgi:hypothetical protein
MATMIFATAKLEDGVTAALKNPHWLDANSGFLVCSALSSNFSLRKIFAAANCKSSVIALCVKKTKHRDTEAQRTPRSAPAFADLLGFFRFSSVSLCLCGERF